LSPLTDLLLERSWSKQVIKIIAAKGEILKPNPSLREFLMGSAVVALFSLVGLGQVAKAQARLAVEPVDPFVFPAIALHVAQVQKAQPKAPGTLVRRQPFQPIGDLLVLVTQDRAVAIASLTDLEGAAG
jgi:hypothetical protein